MHIFDGMLVFARGPGPCSQEIATDESTIKTHAENGGGLSNELGFAAPECLKK